MGKISELFQKNKKQEEKKQEEKKQAEKKTSEASKAIEETASKEPAQNAESAMPSSEKNQRSEQRVPEGSFALGVQDVFELRHSKAVVVVGKVQGIVKAGMVVYVSEFGADNGAVYQTTIKGLEIEEKSLREAANCMVALKLDAPQPMQVRIGSIVHTADVTTKAARDAYITAIGDTYVARKNLDLAENELEAMSIADLAEAWRLFNWYHANRNIKESEDEKLEKQQKVEKLADALCRKILEADEIYTIYDKATGEPHLFSQTYRQENGSYMCSHPDIMLVPKAYYQTYVATYPASKFEVKKIENGENKIGIRDFLGDAFYRNGACGALICSEQTSLDAQRLVQKPDYGDTPQIDIPVTNPDLVRWMLLIGQMGRPESPDAEIVYRLYYRFMAREMVKANFVIPMKTEGEVPQPDESGRTVLKQDMEITFPTMSGKNGRNAVRMYTDWKRLRAEFNEEWNGIIQPIEGMIETFDCAINVTEYPAAGCYISREMFEEMQKIAQNGQQESASDEEK